MRKTDVEKVEDGDWVGDLPDMGDLQVKVRGISNAKYRRLQQELIGAVPRSARRKGRIDPVELERITAICILRTVLLDWKNVEDENGQPVPYSEEQAKAYLTDPAYRWFLDAVTLAATLVGEDQAEADKEDEGNSATLSVGASAGVSTPTS